MLKDELIHLQTKETENGAEIYLDDKLIHHIKDIEIKSSVVTGTAELLIRMKVKYPYSNKSINDDYDPDNPFDDGSNDYTHIYRDAVSTNEVSAQKFSFAAHRGSTYYKERTANINIVTDINGSTATYTTLRFVDGILVSKLS